MECKQPPSDMPSKTRVPPILEPQKTILNCGAPENPSTLDHVRSSPQSLSWSLPSLLTRNVCLVAAASASNLAPGLPSKFAKISASTCNHYGPCVRILALLLLRTIRVQLGPPRSVLHVPLFFRTPKTKKERGQKIVPYQERETVRKTETIEPLFRALLDSFSISQNEIKERSPQIDRTTLRHVVEGRRPNALDIFCMRQAHKATQIEAKNWSSSTPYSLTASPNVPIPKTCSRAPF